MKHFAFKEFAPREGGVPLNKLLALNLVTQLYVRIRKTRMSLLNLDQLSPKRITGNIHVSVAL